jgi:hypothetical protein
MLGQYSKAMTTVLRIPGLFQEFHFTGIIEIF